MGLKNLGAGILDALLRLLKWIEKGEKQTPSCRT